MLLQLAAQSHLIWELNNQPMAKRGKTFHNWPLRKREGNRSRNVFWDRWWGRDGLCGSAIGDFGCFLFAKKKKTENGRERLKLVSNITLKKWKTNFRLEHSDQESRTTFSDVPLRLEIFYEETRKGVFQPRISAHLE